MSDNKPGLWNMLKNAKAMQTSMQDARQQLVKTEFHVESGPVSFRMRGDYKIIPDSLKYQDTNLSPEDLMKHMVNAFEQGVEKIATASNQQVQNLTKEMGLDDMFGGDKS